MEYIRGGKWIFGSYHLVFNLWEISSWRDNMSKKKREHVVFDQMMKPKKSIPFVQVNKCVKDKNINWSYTSKLHTEK